jgi:hypothetical protein
LKMQTSHNINLFMASFNSKYTIYIVQTEAIIVREGEGVLLSRLRNKRTRNRSLLSIVNSKLFYVFPP